jgi:hypothetical protein
MASYAGSCHCGAVTYRVDAEIGEVFRCDCSLCKRRGALMAAVPVSALTILSGKDRLTLYQWNKRIAKHYFCSVCGIYPFHQRRADPNQYGVNTGCLEGFDPSSVPERKGTGSTLSLAPDSAAPDRAGPVEPL